MELQMITSLCVAVVVIIGWRILNWVWIRPKKLEKILRKQGFRGSSYRLFYGDTKDFPAIEKEAISKPINLSDDFIPRGAPVHFSVVNKYGKKSFFWLGPIPVVYISDPDLIKEVFNKSYDFQKPKGGNPLSKLLVGGLIEAEGDRWVKHRKIINPAFHIEKLKVIHDPNNRVHLHITYGYLVVAMQNLLPAFYLSSIEIMRTWEDMVSAEGQFELDVWPYLQTLTSDVISRTVFGSDYEKGRKIFQLRKELARVYMQAAQSVYLPGMRFLPTKRNIRMKKIAGELNSIVRSIIDKRLEEMEAGECIHNDLLSILLQSNSEEIKVNRNMNFGMTVDEVIEECKLFYFAGQETTSDLLVWTMILLSQHLSWQERAREEVFQVFGNSEPHADGLNHLKVVNMILLETLRLYTPGVVLNRAIFEDIKLGEMSLPAGIMLIIPVIQLHHDREIWGDDVKEFKPERFAEGVLRATKGKAAYLPFSMGPRICIGQNFAMLEAKMAISMILQRFSFAISPSYTHAPQTIITLQPQYGANLILKAL